MKKEIFAIIICIALASFTAVGILDEARLTQESLNDKRVTYLGSVIEAWSYDKVKLKEVSFVLFSKIAVQSNAPGWLDYSMLETFKAMDPGSYKTKLLQLKSEVMNAMQTPGFLQKWARYCDSTGYFKINTIEEMAAKNIELHGGTDLVLGNTIGREDITSELSNAISSCNDEIENIDQQLSDKTNPPGKMAMLKEDKQHQQYMLALLNKVKAKESSDDNTYKTAYFLYKRADEIQGEINRANEEIKNINEQLAEIAKMPSDMQASSNKKQFIADKQVYESKKAPYQQIIDQRKTSDAAFTQAYLDFKKKGLLKNEMEELKNFDLQAYSNNRNPAFRLKLLLQQFLKTTQDIDFNAQLTPDKKEFVSETYKQKSDTWKFYFRRGAAFTNAAREAAQQWLGELK